MNIIPAIDILDQRVVRLEQGKFEKEKVYSESPIMIAKKWKDLGAKLIHVVDLDGARLGKPIILDIVREIVDNAKVDVELGGGLRSVEDIENAFKAGARFCVIGTSAVKDEEFCKRLIDKFADKIIFAVDAKDGKVAIKGWKEVSEEDVTEYVKKLETLGAKRIIYTDISRDGMMVGPNLESLKAVLQATSLEVIASGGVSTLEDIRVLKELEKDGLKAAIIGKALYEGKLNLGDAIRAG